MTINTWTDQQQAIFLDAAQGSNHTCVVARAGSGKTTTLVQALQHLPTGSKALMLAFNKKIAAELKQRAPHNVDVATSHSFGLRVLMRTIGHVKVDGNKLYPQTKRWAFDPDVRRSICRAVGLAKSQLAESEGEILGIADSFGLDIGEDEELFAKAVRSLLDWSYETCRQSVDFDDMVWLPNEMQCDIPKYTHVLIDELQDWTKAQIELALQVNPERVIAVGDDRQACYSFRGALQNSIQTISGRLEATLYPLTTTWRCGNAIVQEARRWVPDIEAAPDAEDGSVRRADEADLMAHVQPGDFVLSRLNAPLATIAWRMVRQGKSVSVAGRDFGVGLAALIRKQNASSIEDLFGKLAIWARKEANRLTLANNEDGLTLLEDKMACIDALAEGASTPIEIANRAKTLFDDGAEGIRLSTIHRAKGLEADRVWVLWNTCLRPSRKSGKISQEERNLAYIAVTRARKELIYVE